MHTFLASNRDGTVKEVRVRTDSAARNEPFSLAIFIADAEGDAAFAAKERGCTFTVPAVDRHVGIAGNRDRLSAALAKLLRNAFEFTQPYTEVTLLAYAAGDRVFIDIEDHCGPPGKAEKTFSPFSRRVDDQTWLGLGLTIARHIVEADAGMLRVKYLAGTGCVFTISLPRHDVQ